MTAIQDETATTDWLSLRNLTHTGVHMKKTLRCICFSIPFLVSCITPVKDLKLLSLVPEPKVSKSIGPINAQACVTRLFGIQLGKDPTFSDALGNLSRENEVSYIQNLSFDGSHSFDIFFYGRKCLGVKGVGYK